LIANYIFFSRKIVSSGISDSNRTPHPALEDDDFSLETKNVTDMIAQDAEEADEAEEAPAPNAMQSPGIVPSKAARALCKLQSAPR